jgi:hypothetical protein
MMIKLGAALIPLAPIFVTYVESIAHLEKQRPINSPIDAWNSWQRIQIA